MANILPSRPRQFGPRRTFAIVASLFNEVYEQGLIEHAKRELEAISAGTIVYVYEVPGAFEIPLVVQEVAVRGGMDAIIALGVIFQGATAHADLLARSLTDALLRISLEHRVPVIHEVLHVQSEDQARERCLEAPLNRGTEAARVAVRMSQVMGDFPRR